MQSRFLVRTRDGQEMAPRTLDAFSEMVRSGVIRPDDLVFDALTGMWVPASAHPMVRLFKDIMAHDPLTSAGDDGDLGLGLVEPANTSPEEEAEAFIRRMEEERLRDQEVALARELPLTDPRPSAFAFGASETLVRSASHPVSLPAIVEAHPPRRKSTLYRRGSLGLGLAAVAILVGALVLLRPGVEPGPAVPRGVAGVNAASLGGAGLGAAAGAPTGRVLTATEEDVRADALDRFGKAVDHLRGEVGLGEAPDTWLEGRYLADPESYPEAPRYWSEARSFVEALRARDEELYREAYLEAAEAVGVAGPVRSLRMATALEDFTRDAPRREAHYERVWDLASASLALHELLIELEGRVTYEPIRGGRLSVDPVLEAAGIDPEAQSLLEIALDRVLRALPGSEGRASRDRSHLTEWMVEGVVR